jgi:hypothetical protein
MKTYDIRGDGSGRLWAFEVDNAGLGRRDVCHVVEQIHGAKLLIGPKFLSWFRESTFCKFLVDGELYEAEEPYGDNSRYWIGPRPPRWLPQTEKVREAFAQWPHL